jgi:hypothetical protein
VLAIAGVGYGLATRDAVPPSTGEPFAFLDDEQRAIVAAIVPVMLAGAIGEGVDDVRVVVRGVDAAIADLPPSAQRELRQLFALLGFAPTRALVAGVWTAWSAAPPDAIDGFLRRWRFSDAALLRSGYQAVHQLVMAAWYAEPAAWRRTGYPGPPKLR